MSKTIAFIMLVLITSYIVNATQPSIPPVDKKFIEKAKTLVYSNTPKDTDNLKELLQLYNTAIRQECPSNCVAFKDAIAIFENVFFSYPNDMLLNNVLLTQDKRYNSANKALNIKIINKKKVYDTVPYIIDYLKDSNSTDLYNDPAFSYFNIFVDSGREEVKPFIRNKLIKNLDEMYSKGFINYGGSLITSLGKLNDTESFNTILEFCNRDLLENSNLYESYFQYCLKTFSYYKNHEFVGFVIKKLDYEKLTFLNRFVFPPFALDKSVYFIYTDNAVAYGVGTEPMIQRWQAWYESSKDKIVWSENLSKFIEEGTEEQIKEYLSKADKHPKEYLITEHPQEKPIKPFGFFQSIVNWFKQLFR